MTLFSPQSGPPLGFTELATLGVKIKALIPTTYDINRGHEQNWQGSASRPALA